MIKILYPAGNKQELGVGIIGYFLRFLLLVVTIITLDHVSYY